MHQIRAAIAAGLRPSAPLLRLRNPRGEWSKHDYLLLEAHQTIEDEKCSCGYPIWICHHGSEDIQFRVRPVTCEADRARELKQKHEYGDGKKEKPEGLSLIVEPFTLSGAPLSSFRESYYQQQAKLREDLSESPRR